MICHNVKQRSVEWDKLRIGIPTASEFHRIVTPGTLKLSQQAEGYMDWLLACWIVGEMLERPETEYMTLGQELEERAAEEYAFAHDVELSRLGFVTTDDGMIGCSPDRIVEMVGSGEIVRIDRLIEIKTHPGNPGLQVRAMRERTVEPKYNLQVQGQLWLCEADLADIVNYAPGFPTITLRVNRDEKIISALKTTLSAFVETLLNVRTKLTQEYGPFMRVPRLADNSDVIEIINHFRPVI